MKTEEPKETNNKSFSSKISQTPSIDPKEIVRFLGAFFFSKNKCSVSVLKSFTFCSWSQDLSGRSPSSSLSRVGGESSAWTVISITQGSRTQKIDALCEEDIHPIQGLVNDLENYV